MDLKEQAVPQLCQLVADTLNIPTEAVTLDAGPAMLPQWDSFNHVHLIVAIEDRYKIELDGDEIATMISVREIARVLQERGVVVA